MKITLSDSALSLFRPTSWTEVETEPKSSYSSSPHFPCAHFFVTSDTLMAKPPCSKPLSESFPSSGGKAVHFRVFLYLPGYPADHGYCLASLAEPIPPNTARGRGSTLLGLCMPSAAGEGARWPGCTLQERRQQLKVSSPRLLLRHAPRIQAERELSMCQQWDPWEKVSNCRISHNRNCCAKH